MTQSKEIIVDFGKEKYELSEFELKNMFDELHHDLKFKDVNDIHCTIKYLQDTIYRYEFINLLDGEDIVKMLRLLMWVENIFDNHAKLIVSENS